MVKDFLNVFTKPITKTLEYANKEDLKFSFILVAVITGILTVLNSIQFILNTIIHKSYSYSKGKYITKLEFSNFEFEAFIKNFFTVAVIVVVAILLIATIMYIISRILKNENSFAKLLTIASISTMPVIISTLFSILISWLYAPISYFVTIAAVLYMLFINIYSFRNTLTINDEDTLTILNVVSITVTLIILYYIVIGVLEDSLSMLDMF